MRVECANCSNAFEIPDDRLPKGKEIAFPCPACKGTIKLDLSSKSAQDVPPQSQAEEQEALPTGEALKKRILRTVGDLPPMPQTIHKVREIMSSTSSSFKELAQVLETDPALATKVLKMSNSAYYGMSGQVSSIQHASVVLGHKTLGELMTMAGVSGLLDNSLEGYGLDAGHLWQHSMEVAFGSRIIANKKSPGMADNAFAAGLIHDSGKLILDKHVHERKRVFQEFMANGQQSFLAAEKEILGFDHAEIASEVCKSWNVPDALSVAIRYHHYPSESQGDELAYIVHMADSLAIMTGMGAGIDGMSYQMDDKAMGLLGLKDEDLSEIMIEVVESVEKMTDEATAA